MLSSGSWKGIFAEQHIWWYSCAPPAEHGGANDGIRPRGFCLGRPVAVSGFGVLGWVASPEERPDENVAQTAVSTAGHDLGCPPWGARKCGYWPNPSATAPISQCVQTTTVDRTFVVLIVSRPQPIIGWAPGADCLLRMLQGSW